MRAESKRLADVHARADTRRVPIDRVGIRGLRHPVIVLDKAEGKQHTIAEIDMSVSLPHHFKGTHMSRFVEILSRYHREIDIRNFRHMLEEIRERLDAESAEVEVRFPYFVEKPAPVTRAVGMVSYDCAFGGKLGKRSVDFWVGVRVPVTTLCPCSKEVSDRGAHNQRGEVRLNVRYAKFFWLEDLIALVESCASAPIYSLLKRVDEKYVTEQAYDNPRFVEDLVREVAVRLQADRTFTAFDVEAENFESIHAHNAFARVAWRREVTGATRRSTPRVRK